MKKKYIVKLTNEEHQELTDIISKGKSPAYKIKHANILLKANAEGPNWIDRQIAEAFVCMDEQPIQLIKETRTPLPLEPGKPERHDYEYEVAG
ncbi:hypothetical protein [Alkaliphilus metalliredigens]|uniref:hypothetical protein n=1 Tax=Alkaliphilus metalliredigens TaxID=208226 RepID=UPI00005CC37D